MTGGPPRKDEGSFRIERNNKIVMATLTLEPNKKSYQAASATISLLVPVLKGMSDLSVPRLRAHDLSAALQAYVKARGEFPRGTLDRPLPSNRAVPFRPDQRLAWTASLLPFLGPEYKDWAPNLEESWDEGGNLSIARRVVPELVASVLPGTGGPMVSYPGGPPLPLGATHYVGVAGVGMDAPTYAAGDKRAGVFGYDRATKLSEITNGPEQVIALLLVPGNHKSPWLAGGGSTVRGIPEDDPRPAEAFACITFPAREGQKPKVAGKGTLAIMADGKVRFIPASLPAEVFRTLCTIAGGKKVENLDELCPVVEEETRGVRTEVPPVLPMPKDKGDGKGAPIVPPVKGEAPKAPPFLPPKGLPAPLPMPREGTGS